MQRYPPPLQLESWSKMEMLATLLQVSFPTKREWEAPAARNDGRWE